MVIISSFIQFKICMKIQYFWEIGKMNCYVISIGTIPSLPKAFRPSHLHPNQLLDGEGKGELDSLGGPKKACCFAFFHDSAYFGGHLLVSPQICQPSAASNSFLFLLSPQATAAHLEERTGQ
jgi:hypothetical protein